MRRSSAASADAIPRHSRLKSSWRIERYKTCGGRCLILKGVRRSSRNDHVSSLRDVRPVMVDTHAQRSCNDVEHMVIRVRMHPGAPGARLKPPFGYRVSTSRFFRVRLEDGTHPAHRVNATLFRRDDYRLTDRSSFFHEYAPQVKFVLSSSRVSAIGDKAVIRRFALPTSSPQAEIQTETLPGSRTA